VLASKRSFVAATIISTTLLSGCAAQLKAEDYPSATSQLDYKTMTVNLPLDKYVLSERDAQIVDRANALTFDKCLQTYGYSDPTANRDWSTKPVQADRTFGLWSMDYAEEYGYGIIPDPEGEAIDKQFDESIPARNEAWSKCLTEVKFLDTYRARSSHPGSLNVVDEGYVKAYEATERDDRTKELMLQWQTCAKDKGLQINEEVAFLPVYPENDIAAQMPTAVADVECKESLQFRQKLGDIEAQYQASYAAQHESELEAHRKKAAEVLEEAQRVVNAA
jgi:hypothetical protein